MRRHEWLAPLFVPLALTIAAPSCAESEAGGEPATEDASVGAIDRDLPDGGADAGCTLDGAPCPVMPSCETADFCPVSLPVTSRYVLTAAWGSSKDDAWAVGSAGLIVHWDGGRWAIVASGTTTTLRDIRGTGPDNLWVVGTRAAIFHGLGIENGAMRWAPKPPPVADYNFEWGSEALLETVWVGGANDVWVGGDPIWDGTTCSNRWRARISEASVEGWDRLFEPSCETFGFTTIFAIRNVGTEDLWAVGGGRFDADASSPVVGRTFRAKLAADTPIWEEVDSPSTARLLAVWGTPEGGVWAVGEKGTILHYLPGAPRGSIVPSPTNQTLHAVWGSAPDDVWAVGDRSTIVHFDGKDWRVATTASTTASNLYGLWGSGPNDIWAVGEGIVLHATGKK